LLWIILSLLQIHIHSRNLLWKLDENGLCQISRQKVPFVAWKNVERFAVEAPLRPDRSPLVIKYSPLHSVRVDPANRKGFLAALRQFAPRTEFRI